MNVAPQHSWSPKSHHNSKVCNQKTHIAPWSVDPIGTQQHDEILLRIIGLPTSPFFSKTICNNVCFKTLCFFSQTFVSKVQFGFLLYGRRPTGDMCTHMSKVHRIQNWLQTLTFWSLGDFFPTALLQFKEKPPPEPSWADSYHSSSSAGYWRLSSWQNSGTIPAWEHKTNIHSKILIWSSLLLKLT